MRYPDDAEKDRLGEFHNAAVALIDASTLTVAEVLVVLSMIAHNIERLFETAAKSPTILVGTEDAESD